MFHPETISSIDSEMTRSDIYSTSAYHQNSNYSKATTKLLKELATNFGADSSELSSIMSNMATKRYISIQHYSK